MRVKGLDLQRRAVRLRQQRHAAISNRSVHVHQHDFDFRSALFERGGNLHLLGTRQSILRQNRMQKCSRERPAGVSQHSVSSVIVYSASAPGGISWPNNNLIHVSMPILKGPRRSRSRSSVICASSCTRLARTSPKPSNGACRSSSSRESSSPTWRLSNSTVPLAFGAGNEEGPRQRWT